ncbi:related to nucleoside-diphosphate-sugar epimerase [Cephalotrichum gorgonifer]|uniref:Related to nucleoside-diphosphate-sugar epimerase n=1 Tax=Cephalotrichum gorgonifer TaxID=2041049 RepID=A0AAE8SZU1_9PEZI|nr:related to nucleoside-diphosphate-sugar epimerase [Cephalotrichum gorgonifer]
MDGITHEHVLITGGAGFIGQLLAAALLTTSPTLHITTTDITAPPLPASLTPDDAKRITASASDLTDPAAITSLLQTPYTSVYLLHGLMSGGAEANLELGWKVNWDSHRAIIDHLRHHRSGTVVVFPSSLAVYGPPAAGEITSERTRAQPRSSYGAQKLMVETYLDDMARRDLIDARIVRLPTIIVRPGKPSAAASSFASGILREPLNGKRAVLPVSRNLEMWVCSPRTVVRNLVLAREVPAKSLGGSRVFNLPGITVTVQQILDALREVGGDEAVRLVREEKDPGIEAIVWSWPARFDVTRAMRLGMEGDVSLVENVRVFAREVKL